MIRHPLQPQELELSLLTEELILKGVHLPQIGFPQGCKLAVCSAIGFKPGIAAMS